MRKIWLFFALCLLAVVATSEAAGTPGFYGLDACISSSSSLVAALSPQNRTNCLDGASCTTSQDCANLCSGFATATCVEEQCRYTYGGGSGSGGGTGDSCNIVSPMECQSSQQCVCQRPSGIYDFGQCTGGYCQF